MKIVLDSNVTIAAYATRGLCNELYELCLLEHQLAISEPLLTEIRRGLTNKIKLPRVIIDNISEFMRSEMEVVIAESIAEDACRDITDLEILGIALTVKADVIVNGDNDLLVLKQYKSIPILSPREFWVFLQSNREK